MKLPLAVLTLAFLLAGCSRKGDAWIRKELVGTWASAGSYANGSTFKSTMTIARGDNYVCEVVVHSESGPTRTVKIEGTLQVRDGVLIDTMTKHSNTNAVLPMSTRRRIVRIDEREMIVNWDSSLGLVSGTNELVLRRVGK
jgi:hypothetical protein